MLTKSFTHMSCKSFRLLKTIFSSSKTMPAYPKYGKELFASWSYHTPMTGLSGPDPSPIGHPWDILGRRIHDRIPSRLPHFPNLNTSWLNNGNVFQEGVGYNPWLLLSMRKSLIECIHKGGVIQDMTYNIYRIILITCSCLYLFSTKPVNWGGLLFISMSIYLVHIQFAHYQLLHFIVLS